MDGENRSGIDGSSIASFQECLLTFEWGPIEIVWVPQELKFRYISLVTMVHKNLWEVPFKCWCAVLNEIILPSKDPLLRQDKFLI